MKIDMLMPQMGESIAEATISKWLKNPGDKIEKDEIILEISTDKVDSEIPAPSAGTLVEVLYKQGDVVPVKTKIAIIDTDASAQASAQASRQSVASPKVEPQQLASAATVSVASVSAPLSATPPPVTKAESAGNGASDRFYSPLVKSLASKHSVSINELDAIPGSGQSGRVTKEDFLAYVEAKKSKPAQAQAQQSQTPRLSVAKAAPGKEARQNNVVDMPNFDWAEDGTKIIPMDNMRQAIAEHMVRSKQTSPHVYSVQEIDMTRVSQYRQRHKAKFQESEGFSLSFTPFFLEAAVKALLKFPYVNCSLDGKKIILKRHVNLGCAVALGDPSSGSSGLIVPVIKHAEEKNFVGLARSLNNLAMRARTKKLMPDDVVGGTFTVTNPGVFGTIIGNPIINQPQVAILCLGAIKKRPVVIDDMIGIREMCYLTLSYDHRIIDGSLGGQFLAFLREYLEEWDSERELY